MIIDYVKTALRTNTDNAEVIAQLEILIDAAAADLKSAGVTVELDKAGEYPPLIVSAITIFVCSRFLTDVAVAEKYAVAYQSIKTQLVILEAANG